MFRLSGCFVLASLVGLLATPVRAQQLPIFDAHIHYSQPDWASYSPDAILALLDKTGVRWAIVSSTPDDARCGCTRRRPTGSRRPPTLSHAGRHGHWTTDASIVPYVRERLKRGSTRPRGVPPLGRPAGDPVVKDLAALGVQRGLFLYAHTDAAGIEELLRRYRRRRWLWAHAGLGEPFEVVARVADRTPRS